MTIPANMPAPIRAHRHAGLRLAAPLIVLTLSACSTPKHASVQPHFDLPESFGATGDAELPAQWWEHLQDPALDRMIAEALDGNFSLRAAWERLAQAEAVARRQGADLWPELRGEAAASRVQRQRPEGDESTGTETTRSASLGLAASYELDLWGRVRSLRQAAALDAAASREQLHSAAMSLSAELAAAWYAWVEQQAQIRLLEDQMAVNQQVLALVEQRRRLGQADAADVLQQEQLIEARQGDLARARARAEILAAQLSILRGLPPSGPPATEAPPLPEVPPLPATGLPAEWLQRRPDLRHAALAVEAADRRAAAALADQWPRISLSAGLSTQGERTRDLFDNWLSSLAANLAAPLFEGGARRAETARARAALAEQLHQFSQTVLGALADVEEALIQERRQAELAASLDRQLELSGQALDRLRLRYAKGQTDYLRVLSALIARQNVERDRLQAGRNLLEYRIALCRALGGGWPLPPPSPARPFSANAPRPSSPQPEPLP